MDNPGQVITNYKKEVVKKKNKCAANKKERLAKLCASVGSFSSLYFESSFFLLPCCMLAPMSALVPALVPVFMPALKPTLVLAPMLASFSHLRSLVVLSFDHLPVPAASSALFLPHHAFVSCYRILALLLSLFVLGLSFFLGS